MTDQPTNQPITVTVDGVDYDMADQSQECKAHFVESVNLKKEIDNLNEQITAAMHRANSLAVALEWRNKELTAALKADEPEKVAAVN